MTVHKGFYRHYRDGDVYYVHGVGTDHHNGFKRLVVYTSVKTEVIGEPGQPPYDYLLRDEREFEQWLSPSWSQDESGCDQLSESEEYMRSRGLVRRFEPITRPAQLRIPA